MSKAYEFLKECGAFFVLSINGDSPAGRPFGAVMEDGAYLYLSTNDMNEAHKQSKQMMYGHRFQLFCLQLSFIGWDILATLAFGIGYLWLTPYKQAATAAFYREVSGTETHRADAPAM